jgi:uncharacterized membrane protein
MIDSNPRSTASIAGHPLHAMVVPIPLTCFIGAFVTDLVYWQSKGVEWETFSVWLLTAGLIMGGFAVLAGLIDFFGSRRIRALPQAWIHALGNLAAVFLEVINAFVHSRDGYTAVVPEGLILSGLSVLILVVTSWFGASMVYRHRVGVTP